MTKEGKCLNSVDTLQRKGRLGRHAENTAPRKCAQDFRPDLPAVQVVVFSSVTNCTICQEMLLVYSLRGQCREARGPSFSSGLVIPPGDHPPYIHSDRRHHMLEVRLW